MVRVPAGLFRDGWSSLAFQAHQYSVESGGKSTDTVHGANFIGVKLWMGLKPLVVVNDQRFALLMDWVVTDSKNEGPSFL